MVLKFDGAALAEASVHLDLWRQDGVASGGSALGRHRFGGMVGLVGDWNLIQSDEARMNAEGTHAHSSDRTGSPFEQVFEGLPETFEHDVSWSRRCTSGVDTTRSRIDRTYMQQQLYHAQADSGVWNAVVAGGLSERARPSDHIPVSVVLRARPRRSSSKGLVPQYVLDPTWDGVPRD